MFDLSSAVMTLQRNAVVSSQPTPAAKTAATTLTSAELLGGIITANPGAAVNYQLPLASDLEVALAALVGGLSSDDAFQVAIINTATAANIVTVTTNSGWTLVGNMAVAGATTGEFKVRRTAAGAYTIYRL